ncbi:MAG TPA: DUF4893 domain-containing protein, partial [Brevundimonas sp.]|nr:DUF4893 domain-containing protein [Brevundimonas sp.]
MTPSLLATALLAGCATTPPPPPPPPPSAPDAPSGAVLSDWRGVITAADRDRYQRRDAAWTLALQQAKRQPGSGDLSSLGGLIDPNAARLSVTPPVGNYRCRIERTAAGLKFSKLTGSQRPSGLLFPENDRHMVFLGSMSLASEPAARSYGQRPERDMVA